MTGTLDAPSAVEGVGDDRRRAQTRRRLLRTGAALGLTWLVAAAVIAGLHSTRPTATSIGAWCAAHPLTSRTDTERAQLIETLGHRMALLDHWERRELTNNRDFRAVYTSFTSPEKERFIQRTVNSAINETFRAAAAMPSTEREKFLNQTFYEMETTFSKDTSAAVYQKRVVAWVEQAVREGLAACSPALRAEILPVIEQNYPSAARGF